MEPEDSNKRVRAEDEGDSASSSGSSRRTGELAPAQILPAAKKIKTAIEPVNSGAPGSDEKNRTQEGFRLDEDFRKLAGKKYCKMSAIDLPRSVLVEFMKQKGHIVSVRMEFMQKQQRLVDGRVNARLCDELYDLSRSRRTNRGDQNKYCKAEQIPHEILVEFAKRNKYIKVVQLISVAVCTLDGSTFEVVMDTQENRVSLLKDAVQHQHGTSRLSQRLFLISKPSTAETPLEDDDTIQGSCSVMLYVDNWMQLRIEELKRFYQIYNPDKMRDAGDLLQNYPFEKLCAAIWSAYRKRLPEGWTYQLAQRLHKNGKLEVDAHKWLEARIAEFETFYRKINATKVSDARRLLTEYTFEWICKAVMDKYGELPEGWAELRVVGEPRGVHYPATDRKKGQFDFTIEEQFDNIHQPSQWWDECAHKQQRDGK